MLGELKDLAESNRAAFAKGFQAWKHDVENEAESRGFLDPQADRMAFGASAFAFVAIVAAGAAAVFSGFWWFFLGIPVGIALVFVARAVKRRSGPRSCTASTRPSSDTSRTSVGSTRSRRTRSSSGSSSSSTP